MTVKGIHDSLVAISRKDREPEVARSIKGGVFRLQRGTFRQGRPESVETLKDVHMSKQNSEILLVGSELSSNDRLQKELLARAYKVNCVNRGEEALARVKTDEIDVVVSELEARGLSGLELLRQLHPVKPRLPIILIDKSGRVETAIEATKLGVFEYLVTPIKIWELIEHIARAVSHRREVLWALDSGRAETAETGLVGSSHVMRELYKQIGLAADSSLPILIRGETGTGKELIARAIHHHSDRASHPFIAVNCNAIPDTLFESELFGHEAGAFTGARSRRIGMFERAKGGTLFLDEIGDITMAMQIKLLRVIQERQLQRLGGSQDVNLDARVVAATHRDLEALIGMKEFREDLFYRLSALTVTAPALCEHRDDIFELTKHFLRKCQTDKSQEPLCICPEAVDFLERQDWPGNVRQLEHAVCRAALMARGQPIELIHAREAYGNKAGRSSPAGAPLRRPEPLTDLFERAQAGKLKNLKAYALQQTERTLYERAMAFAHGNQVKIAKLLGVTRTTVRQAFRKFGLAPADGHNKSDQAATIQTRPQPKPNHLPEIIRKRDNTARPDSSLL